MSILNPFGKIKPFGQKIVARYDIFIRRLRNRLPEGIVDFAQRRIVPYLGILLVFAFTLVADMAKASENDYTYEPSAEMMDLSPADVAGVVSVVGPVTTNIEEDPLTVAIAMEDATFLDKPEITETKITEEPKAPEKRSKTIVYTVEDGDTLGKIAWKYSLKISTIKTTNNLSSDIIRPGQRLNIPPQDVSTTQLANLTKKVAGARYPFTGTFRRPTSGWAVSQVFGRTNYESWHTGIDLDSRSGRTIFASASGKVVGVIRGWGSGYGNHIIIDHGQGFTTLYGHLSSFSVSSGQWVNQGQAIGIMGSTGWSTGIHLHFEIRKNGAPQNPMSYL